MPGLCRMAADGASRLAGFPLRILPAKAVAMATTTPPPLAPLSPATQTVLDHAAAAPMREQVLDWAAINTGTGNLTGLASFAGKLADAFAVLPGDLRLVDPAAVDGVDADGATFAIRRGQHLHLTVRPDAAVRVLLTGHMDTVFPASHQFQQCRWIDDDRLNGSVGKMQDLLKLMAARRRAWGAATSRWKARTTSPGF